MKCLLLHSSVLTVMRSGLIIVGVVLAAVALSEARSPPRPEACTADWNPVCGVDNKTYGNACMARSKYVDSTKSYLVFTHMKIQYTIIVSTCILYLPVKLPFSMKRH